jgi:hypothetical protein
MRKWKRGVIALIVLFLTGVVNYYMKEFWSGLAFIISGLYGVGLIVLFLFQRWSKERAKLKIEEKVVKTKVIAVYECGHCKTQYTKSQTCPKCGSPYRRTVEEKIEEETVEKWKT